MYSREGRPPNYIYQLQLLIYIGSICNICLGAARNLERGRVSWRRVGILNAGRMAASWTRLALGCGSLLGAVREYKDDMTDMCMPNPAFRQWNWPKSGLYCRCAAREFPLPGSENIHIMNLVAEVPSGLPYKFQTRTAPRAACRRLSDVLLSGESQTGHACV
jgi:hypothetical protein